MLEELLDPRQVFVPPDTGGDGDDVLGTEYLRRDSFVFDRPRCADGLFSEAYRCEKMNRELMDEQMLALDPPAAFQKVCLDRRNAGAQSFLGGDKDDIGVVGSKRLDVIDCCQRTSQRVILNQTSGDEIVRPAQDVRQLNRGGFLAHSKAILAKMVAAGEARSARV